MSAYSPHSSNEPSDSSDRDESNQGLYTPMTPEPCFLGARSPNTRSQTSSPTAQQPHHGNSPRASDPCIPSNTPISPKKGHTPEGYVQWSPSAIRSPGNTSPYSVARHEEDMRKQEKAAPMLNDGPRAMAIAQPSRKRPLSETIAAWKRNKDIKDAAERAARGGPSPPRNRISPEDLIQRPNPDPSLKDHKFFKNILNF